MSNKKRGIDRRKLKLAAEFPLQLASGEIIEQDRRSYRKRRENDFISEQYFFSGVPYHVLEPLISLCNKILLNPGDVLLEPQQPNRNLYLLLDGELKVHIDKVDSEEGFIIQTGEFLGELSVIDGQLPSAYVVAEKASHVLAISDEILWNDFFKNPKIARNFMRLFAQRMRDRNQHIQRALEQELRYEHLQKELSIARNIQSSMLPSGDYLCDKFPVIDIRGSMTAANQVGGDFFDAFPLYNNRICLSIGDVSGKGIPASLFMVKTITLLREEIRRKEDLTGAVKNLNVKLCKDNDSCMFSTLIVGILDFRDNLLSFINAGHNLPLYGPAGKAFNFLKTPKGILVGINEYAEYQVTTLKLQKNDVFVLYTDGVTEAMNPDHEVYSDERFQNLLNTTDTSSAQSVVTAIKDSVKIFADGAAQSDDLTLLVFRYCD